MEDCYYFSAEIGCEKRLCLSPLTERAVCASGETVSDSSGYFLYEKKRTGDYAQIDIIAHVQSHEAALRLKELLGLV
jgi:hypothetical protein